MPTEQPIESIPLRREAVNVAVLLELPTDVMQRQARALGITLTIRIDDDVPDTVRLDRDKVAWAITNLVGSALRHVRSPGGVIDVHVTYDIPQSTLSIAVRDDGPGITADRLAKFRNRAAWHPGAALALLLVEDIATAHGGRLEIESKTDRRDHFTTVRLALRSTAGRPS